MSLKILNQNETQSRVFSANKRSKKFKNNLIFYAAQFRFGTASSATLDFKRCQSRSKSTAKRSFTK
jgi:hypothetical protein